MRAMTTAPPDPYRDAFEGYRVERVLAPAGRRGPSVRHGLRVERPVSSIHVLAPDAATPERQARFRRTARLFKRA